MVGVWPPFYKTVHSNLKLSVLFCLLRENKWNDLNMHDLTSYKLQLIFSHLCHPGECVGNRASPLKRFTRSGSVLSGDGPGSRMGTQRNMTGAVINNPLTSKENSGKHKRSITLSFHTYKGNHLIYTTLNQKWHKALMFLLMACCYMRYRENVCMNVHIRCWKLVLGNMVHSQKLITKHHDLYIWVPVI